MRPETKRARGKRLLADLAEVNRTRSGLARRKSDLDLKMSMLDMRAAEILAEMADSDIQLETGTKRRKDARPELVDRGGATVEMDDDVERAMNR